MPYLSDIPLLGWMFEHEERSRTKDNLLVFLTPSVIRSSAETQRVLERELQHRHGMYGERLKQIIYGDDPGFDAGHTPVGAPTQSAAATEPGQADEQQWATFVQDDQDPADQDVVDQVENGDPADSGDPTDSDG